MAERSEERAKVLITGGTGFIGSYLAMDLLKKGNEVVVADRSYDLRRIEGFKDEFEKNKDRLTFIQGDLSLSEHVHQWFDEFRPQSVYHLGALIRGGGDEPHAGVPDRPPGIVACLGSRASPASAQKEWPGEGYIPQHHRGVRGAHPSGAQGKGPERSPPVSHNHVRGCQAVRGTLGRLLPPQEVGGLPGRALPLRHRCESWTRGDDRVLNPDDPAARPEPGLLSVRQRGPPLGDPLRQGRRQGPYDAP